MKYLKLFESFNSGNKYNILWTQPTEDYMVQELDEFFRVIRFSKNPGGYLHPSNLDVMMKVMPITLTKFAELIHQKASHLLPKYLNLESTKDILLNIKEQELKVTPEGYFSSTLMDLMPICEELKKNTECRNEGIRLLKTGREVEWSEDKVEQTTYMGKLSDFAEYGFQDTDDPVQILKQIKDKIENKSNNNLKGFLKNIETFMTEGIKELPMPFVFRYPSGGIGGKIYSLFGGHKRSSVALQLGIPIKVWFIDLTKMYL